MVTAHATHLSALFYREEIRLASPISKENMERSIPSSDFGWPKENTQTIVSVFSVISFGVILIIDKDVDEPLKSSFCIHGTWKRYKCIKIPIF